MGAILIILLVFLLNPIIVVGIVSKLSRADVIYQFNNEKKQIALTIDDGPHPTITPLILDLLEENQSKATFFLTGKNIQEHSDIVSQIIAEGHEIGNHMYDHNFSILLDADDFRDQLSTTNNLLIQNQISPVWYRPGGGLYNQSMATQAESMGYKICLGSVYPYDATIPEEVGGAKFIQRFITRNSQPGAIIILHDGRIRTVNVLQYVLPLLIDDGYQFVTLSELATTAENGP